MPPKSNVPVRICGSKTRSGCSTCKKRHVKCDERRPVCLRCQKADRQCVYHQPQLQILQQTSGPNQEAGPSMSVILQSRSYLMPPGLNSSISPYGSREVAEVGAVKHFVAHLGTELAGCLPDDVWCHIFPQVAQYEPSIWNAIVAISMLDTSFRLGHNSHGGKSDANVAVKQYSKAIQELNVRLGSGDNTCCKDVVLLCCILFTVFECLQSHYQSALQHISGGMKLLIEWDREAQSNNQTGSGGYLNRNILQPIFLSLDSQAVQMGVVSFRDYFSLPAINDQLQIPTCFATVEEAHLLLNHIFNRLSHWAIWVEPSVACGNKPGDAWMAMERQRLQRLFAEWDSAFEIPLMLYYPRAPVLLLLTQRKVMQIFFATQIDGSSELKWDKYLLLFQEAVEYAEAYMKLTTGDSQPATAGVTSSTGHSDTTRPAFTVAMDIVLPLFMISMKCRDSGVRRRALAMLKMCGRKEGIWDSDLCARVAEKIIEMEERSASTEGYIPESARIYELDVRFGEEKVGEVTHKKLVPDDDGCHHIETMKESLAW